MIRRCMLCLVAALVVATPAAAQNAAPTPALAPPPATAAAPDPARVAAATQLIARLLPADRAEAMIDQMIRPTMGNLHAAMAQAPELKAAFARNPKARAALDAFVADEIARSSTIVKQALPTLRTAMARAYARRFTEAQLNEIAAFFDTPTGRLYAEQAPTIMGDPDILAAQRAMMTQAMQGVAERAQAMAAKLAAEQDRK